MELWRQCKWEGEATTLALVMSKPVKPPIPPRFCGNLRKFGQSLMSGWKSRYFVLEANRVFYYKAEGEEPVGSIDIESCIVSSLDGGSTKDGFQFTIHVAERIYRLSAASASLRAAWVAAVSYSSLYYRTKGAGPFPEDVLAGVTVSIPITSVYQASVPDVTTIAPTIRPFLTDSEALFVIEVQDSKVHALVARDFAKAKSWAVGLSHWSLKLSKGGLEFVDSPTEQVILSRRTTVPSLKGEPSPVSIGADDDVSTTHRGGKTRTSPQVHASGHSGSGAGGTDGGGVGVSGTVGGGSGRTGTYDNDDDDDDDDDDKYDGNDESVNGQGTRKKGATKNGSTSTATTKFTAGGASDDDDDDDDEKEEEGGDDDGGSSTSSDDEPRTPGVSVFGGGGSGSGSGGGGSKKSTLEVDMAKYRQSITVSFSDRPAKVEVDVWDGEESVGDDDRVFALVCELERMTTWDNASRALVERLTVALHSELQYTKDKEEKSTIADSLIFLTNLESAFTTVSFDSGRLSLLHEVLLKIKAMQADWQSVKDAGKAVLTTAIRIRDARKYIGDFITGVNELARACLRLARLLLRRSVANRVATENSRLFIRDLDEAAVGLVTATTKCFDRAGDKAVRSNQIVAARVLSNVVGNIVALMGPRPMFEIKYDTEAMEARAKAAASEVVFQGRAWGSLRAAFKLSTGDIIERGRLVSHLHTSPSREGWFRCAVGQRVVELPSYMVDVRLDVLLNEGTGRVESAPSL